MAKNKAQKSSKAQGSKAQKSNETFGKLNHTAALASLIAGFSIAALGGAPAQAQPVPAPKASDVKCPGCAMALLKGGRCAAHGDPRLAHANGVAATGKERTLKGLAATSPKAQKKLAQKLAREERAQKAAARKAAKAARAAKLSAQPAKKAHIITDPVHRAVTDGKRAQVHALLIKVLVKENPRRAGSRLHSLFAALKTGMTVGDYLMKSGAIMANLNKCVSKGWVKLVSSKKEVR